jgi:hypothetical protein
VTVIGLRQLVLDDEHAVIRQIATDQVEREIPNWVLVGG